VNNIKAKHILEARASKEKLIGSVIFLALGERYVDGEVAVSCVENNVAKYHQRCRASREESVMISISAILSCRREVEILYRRAARIANSSGNVEICEQNIAVSGINGKSATRYLSISAWVAKVKASLVLTGEHNINGEMKSIEKANTMK
jgi:hypothetical protein